MKPWRSVLAYIVLVAVGVLLMSLLIYAAVHVVVLQGRWLTPDRWLTLDAWLPKDVSEARAQLGQLGDFLNPFLSFTTILFVLATFRLQLSEARRQQVAAAIQRYEAAVMSIQYVQLGADDRVWTGREAFMRFFREVNDEFNTVQRLSDAGTSQSKQSSLVTKIVDGRALNLHLGRQAHSFQHAYLAMLDLLDFGDETLSGSLSDVELLFYLPFVCRLRAGAAPDGRDRRAIAFLADALEKRGYRQYRDRVRSGAEAA